MLKKFFLGAALIAAVGSALAQSVAAPTAFDLFMQKSTGAGKQTVGFAKDGTPMISAGVPTITPDGGQPRVNTSGSLRNPSGNSVPVTATGRLTGPVVAKAIGRAAAKIAPGIAWAIAIKELAVELGFDLGQNTDGTPKFQKLDPAVCSVAPCVEVRYAVAGIAGQYFYSKLAACQSSAAAVNASAYYAYANNPRLTGDLCTADFVRRSNGAAEGAFSVAVNATRTVAPQPSAMLPSAQQEFLDAVAAKSGWPSSSAIARALADPSTQGDEKLETGPMTITGPATSPGVQKVTQNTTNNTTKTETTTHNHTYQGDTVTTTTVTSINITNNTTGVTESSETVTAPAPAPEPVETCGLPGKPACKIDETGTPTYDAEKFKLDKAKLDQDALDLRNKVKGSEDKGMFSSWGQFFSLPALRACEPLQLPVYFGYTLPSMDVCPGAEWLRNLMGFVWAIAGFAFCFKSVQDSI